MGGKAGVKQLTQIELVGLGTAIAEEFRTFFLCEITFGNPIPM